MEIKERLAEIRSILESGEECDVNALTEEIRALKEQLINIEVGEGANLDDLEEHRQELKEQIEERKIIENTDGKELKKMEERKEYGIETMEYRNAFFKNLLDMELTPEERAAFTTTTATAGALPVTTVNKIWDNIYEQHSILGDVTIYRTGTILEVTKHTAIAQGAAKTVNEGEANDDEQNTFVTVTLSGKDFSKHVNISYAARNMGVDALESYLVNEIALGIGEAIASDIIAQIGTDTASANKISVTGGTIDFADLVGAFAKLKRCTKMVAYTSNAFLYNQLVALTDLQGRPLFQPSLNEGVSGNLLGATVKLESACGGDKLVIIDPQKFVYNMVTDVMVESERDIKNHVYTYSGYARGEGALMDSESAVVLTVGA